MLNMLQEGGFPGYKADVASEGLVRETEPGCLRKKLPVPAAILHRLQLSVEAAGPFEATLGGIRGPRGANGHTLYGVSHLSQGAQ